jgi:phosphatidate phosphatase LPIN
MTLLVDQMFPPVNQKLAADFTDFNYWRAPIDEYELPNLDPPSPTLSASSDTYRLSRLRNFSLRGKSSSQSLADHNNKQQSEPSKGEVTPQSHARASSPLASPALSADDIEEREDLEKSGLSTGRLHRKSQLDTPRPLDDRLLEDPDFGKGASYHEDTHDEPGEPEDYDESESDGHQHHDPEEETFDDDLLATGEMDNIPFL